MQNMRELFRSTLGRSLRELPALDRLAAAWPVACGPALASRGAPADYDNGTLHVTLTDIAWRQPFEQARAVLASDLTRIAGVPVRAIHFELAGAAAHDATPFSSEGPRKA
jgi:hypothetical protein